MHQLTADQRRRLLGAMQRLEDALGSFRSLLAEVLEADDQNRRATQAATIDRQN